MLNKKVNNMLLEEKVELLINGYTEVLKDGVINVNNEHNITIDEGVYIVGFDR